MPYIKTAEADSRLLSMGIDDTLPVVPYLTISLSYPIMSAPKARTAEFPNASLIFESGERPVKGDDDRAIIFFP